MRIAEVIGNVTLSRCHPNLAGSRWRLVVPQTQDNLRGDASKQAEPIVAYDMMSSGVGSLIAIAESGEAASPFYPDKKPVSATIVALLDNIEL